jgi:hypothetical protein
LEFVFTTEVLFCYRHKKFYKYTHTKLHNCFYRYLLPSNITDVLLCISRYAWHVRITWYHEQNFQLVKTDCFGGTFSRSTKIQKLWKIYSLFDISTHLSHHEHIGYNSLLLFFIYFFLVNSYTISINPPLHYLGLLNFC